MEQELPQSITQDQPLYRIRDRISYLMEVTDRPLVWWTTDRERAMLLTQEQAQLALSYLDNMKGFGYPRQIWMEAVC